MTLRQLMTHSEKCARDLAEQVHNQLLLKIADFRDLSRPVRRRSHYPTVVAMQNALRKLTEAAEQVHTMYETLHEHLEVIREHAHRERISRR